MAGKAASSRPVGHEPGGGVLTLGHRRRLDQDQGCGTEPDRQPAGEAVGGHVPAGRDIRRAAGEAPGQPDRRTGGAQLGIGLGQRQCRLQRLQRQPQLLHGQDRHAMRGELVEPQGRL